jgi:hypothetical protein
MAPLFDHQCVCFAHCEASGLCVAGDADGELAAHDVGVLKFNNNLTAPSLPRRPPRSPRRAVHLPRPPSTPLHPRLTTFVNFVTAVTAPRALLWLAPNQPTARFFFTRRH